MSNEELQNRITVLEAWRNSLESSNTIPLSIDQAFRARFIETSTALTTSSKASNSENQGVNEAGASTYSVLGIPDGFLQITINNTTYYIPIYT